MLRSILPCPQVGFRQQSADKFPHAFNALAGDAVEIAVMALCESRRECARTVPAQGQRASGRLKDGGQHSPEHLPSGLDHSTIQGRMNSRICPARACRRTRAKATSLTEARSGLPAARSVVHCLLTVLRKTLPILFSRTVRIFHASRPGDVSSDGIGEVLASQDQTVIGRREIATCAFRWAIFRGSTAASSRTGRYCASRTWVAQRTYHNGGVLSRKRHSAPDTVHVGSIAFVIQYRRCSGR